MASASKPFKVVSDDFHISKVESEVEFEQAMVIRFKGALTAPLRCLQALP